MNKAVFLDRDGTINVDKGYLYQIKDFEYLPGVVEGLRLFQQRGYILVVITNQSGIARGLYTEEDYYRLESWMENDLAEKGINIKASYFCPHHPNGLIHEYAVKCECRKPKLGLFFKAAKEWNIDLDESVAIGDKLRDLAVCNESRCKGMLISNDAKKIPGGIQSFCNWNELIQFIKDKKYL